MAMNKQQMKEKKTTSNRPKALQDYHTKKKEKSNRAQTQQPLSGNGTVANRLQS